MSHFKYTEVAVASPTTSVFSSENRQQRRDMTSNFASQVKQREAARRREVDSQSPVYYEYRNSPFCRSMLVVLIILISFIVICVAFLLGTELSCGLGSSRHKVALKNETNLIQGTGLVKEGNYGPDEVTKVGITQAAPVTLLHFLNGEVPSVLVLNETSADSKLRHLSFGAAKSPGTTILNIEQKDRRSTGIGSVFFNSGWYFVKGVAKEYPAGTDVIGTLKNGNQWKVPLVTDINSIFPVYYANLGPFSVSRGKKCNSDFDISIETAAFEVFKLLLVRDYSGDVQFKNAAFNGNLAINGESRLLIDNSSIESILLLKSAEVELLSGNVTLEIPNAGNTPYYAITGATDESLYRAKIEISADEDILIKFSKEYTFTEVGADYFWRDGETGDTIILRSSRTLSCNVVDGKTECTAT